MFQKHPLLQPSRLQALASNLITPTLCRSVSLLAYRPCAASVAMGLPYSCVWLTRKLIFRVHLCVCVCACACVYVCACMHACVRVSVCMSLFLCNDSTWIPLFTRVCMHASPSTLCSQTFETRTGRVSAQFLQSPCALSAFSSCSEAMERLCPTGVCVCVCVCVCCFIKHNVEQL